MLLPSLTIHSIVKYSAVAIKRWGVQNVRVRQWLPSALGCVLPPSPSLLSFVPLSHAAADVSPPASQPRFHPLPPRPLRRARRGLRRHDVRPPRAQALPGRDFACAPGARGRQAPHAGAACAGREGEGRVERRSCRASGRMSGRCRDFVSLADELSVFRTLHSLAFCACLLRARSSQYSEPKDTKYTAAV